MIAPLQQILLIFIISGYFAMGAAISGHLSAWETLWGVLGGNLGLVVAAFLLRRPALRQMERATDPVAVLGAYEQRLHRLRSMSIGWLAINLFLMDWGRVVRQGLWHLPLGRASGWGPLAEMIYLTPPVLVWICFWLAEYRLEALANAREAEVSGRHGRRFHPMPTRRQYVMLYMRTNLYLVFFVLLIWVMQGAVTGLADALGLTQLAPVIGLIPVLVLLVFSGKS